MTDRVTDRWTGVTALAFIAAGIGILLGQPITLLVSAAGVAYAAYAQPMRAPEATVAIDRSLSATDPDPGEEVTVTVTVTNVGDQLLPDLRVVDGVPDALRVVDGSPRRADTLRPGATTSMTYDLEASRGVHEWGETTVITRNWSGTAERESGLSTADAIRCIPSLERDLDEFPLRKQTVEHAGRVTTDSGGAGIEFHATREYQHGDPMHRIDWKRTAKTGEFTTIQFREERAATVALVVDTRRDAYVSDREDVSAVEHSIRGARTLAPALMGAGNSVGVAAFGPVWTWLNPSLGRDHRARLRETLATGDGFAPLPSGDRYLPRQTIRRLRNHLPGDAQVIFFSPVADDYLVTTLRRIEAYGHDVTLVSPDVTDTTTHGGLVATMERSERLRAVRRAGIRVVDWDPDTPLRLAVQDAIRGWTQ
ncbi:MAG: DUF58 domain-containing protein [Halobacteriaceae archaeon]